jgi:hypothetical protein
LAIKKPAEKNGNEPKLYTLFYPHPVQHAKEILSV